MYMHIDFIKWHAIFFIIFFSFKKRILRGNFLIEDAPDSLHFNENYFIVQIEINTMWVNSSYETTIATIISKKKKIIDDDNNSVW